MGTPLKIETAITEMLGIDLPIFAAPMFLVSSPDLVIAVSEAGGLGCFPSMNYRTIGEFEAVLQEIQGRSDKPFGVNLVLYKEHNPDWKKQFDLCLQYGVRLVITSMGTPRTVIREARSAGVKIFCDVTTLRMAQVVATAGADALIAVAQGAGGHAGAISPFSLIPYLKKETGLPVLAAGSIGTGAQMAAAFALGASAVYCGTRFICTNESAANEQYRQMIIDSSPEEIRYTPEVSGVPANWLVRSLDAWDKNRKSHPDEEWKRWRDIWSAGHGVAQIESVLPAAEVVRNIAAEYLEVKNSLP